MRKEDIAHQVKLANKGYTMRKCMEIVTAVLDCIADGIDEDGRAEFRRFGVFRTMEKTARSGRNPKTLEPAEISARRVVQFKPSKALRARVLEVADGSL